MSNKNKMRKTKIYNEINKENCKDALFVNKFLNRIKRFLSNRL